MAHALVCVLEPVIPNALDALGQAARTVMGRIAMDVKRLVEVIALVHAQALVLGDVADVADVLAVLLHVEIVAVEAVAQAALELELLAVRAGVMRVGLLVLDIVPVDVLVAVIAGA